MNRNCSIKEYIGQLTKVNEQLQLEIIERKKAENGLLKSEQKFRAIFENVGSAAIVVEEDARISLSNAKFEKLSGYLKKEIEGRKSIKEFVVKDDLKRLEENYHMLSINDNPAPVKYGFRFIDCHGNIKDIYATSSLIPETKQILISFSDTSQLKQADEKTKFAHAELNQIFNTISGGIRLIDKNFNVLKANQGILNLSGISIDETTGKKCYETFSSDLCNTPECILTKIFSGEERIAMELEKKCINGKTIPCILSATPFRAHDGELIGIVEHLTDITLRKKYENELQNTLKDLRRTLRGTIQAMALTVETRDPYTAGHQQRVADLARTIAKEMGFPRDKVMGIRMAGVLHDIGKIAIPAEILSKPGRLNGTEFELIKNHSQVGYDILKSIKFPWPVAQIIFQHHERMDGSGYPKGLSGEDILPEARILGLADVVEAMASHRPYRPALGIDKALEEISLERGILYDVETVNACLKVFKNKEFKFK